ncbi:MAG: serine hydrolase [Planctomycetota bacterium]
MVLAALLCLSVALPQSPAPAPAPSVAPSPAPRDLAAILRTEPACVAVLDRAKEHRLQIVLAEFADPLAKQPKLVKSRLGDPQQYFYPASAIKLCAAVGALLALQDAAVRDPSVTLDAPVVIGARFAGDKAIAADATDVDGGPLTFRHLLRKLVLVSDNAAHNHCVELLGPDGLNRRRWEAGFASARLWHRLSEARTPDENRQTREVRVGELVFPAREAGIGLANDGWTELDVGSASMQGGKRVDGPLSFAQKNAIALDDLQDVLVAVMRPDVALGKRGFPDLSRAHRRFLVQALGELPRESANPKYDPATTPDHACKFVLRGVREVVPAEALRVYDKIGRAYGFSTENAYLVDGRDGRAFFLAITLYTNADGVLNDDRYGYEDVADPFLDAAGRAIARAVFGQPR